MWYLKICSNTELLNYIFFVRNKFAFYNKLTHLSDDHTPRFARLFRYGASQLGEHRLLHSLHPSPSPFSLPLSLLHPFAPHPPGILGPLTRGAGFIMHFEKATLVEYFWRSRKIVFLKMGLNKEVYRGFITNRTVNYFRTGLFKIFEILWVLSR